MSRTILSHPAVAYILLFLMSNAVCARAAFAEQFSYQCKHGGEFQFLTFDDRAMHVIGYGIGVDGRIVDAIFTGNISAVTEDEIRFDLKVAFDNMKVGQFALNRRDKWLSAMPASEQTPPGEQARDACLPTPLRPVTDLWRILGVDD